MKRALAVFCIFLFAAAGCKKRPNFSQDNSTIVCFGDSLTYGKGAQEGKNYPFYLQKLLRFNVINSGVNGDTTSSALLRLKKDVLRYHPFLAIVELGGNDYLKGIPFSQTLSNLKKIINILQAGGIKVVLCDVFDYPFMRRYQLALADLARSEHCLLIPHVLAGIVDNPALMSDSIHPNSYGYQIMASRIYEGVRKILDK